MLNYFASLMYLATMALCLGAAVTGKRTGRSSSDMTVWLSIAAMFGAFIAMRLLGGEDFLRGILRGIAAGEGVYSTRMAGQLAALIILAGLAWLGWHKIRQDWRKKRGSRSANYIRFALLGVAGFALLYGLRLVSLHAIDRLLYAGPVRLNWLLDGAFTVLIAGAAILYWRHCSTTAPGGWVVNEVPEKPRKKRQRSRKSER